MRPIAVIVEVFAGWIAFLGAGHILVGITEKNKARTITGLVLMIGWWLTAAIMAGIALGTLGTGLICVVPIWFVVPILSGLTILYPDTPGIGSLVKKVDEKVKEKTER